MTGAGADDLPDLSVVIPAYGEGERLARCLAAVERALAAAVPPLRAEIVVADDATPGGLPPALAEAHPRVRFEVGRRNLGFAGNANRGVAAARGAVVCLLNSDMYVEPGWFDDCLAAFAADPALFAVCGRIREPSGRNDGYKTLALEGAAVRVRHLLDADPICDAPAEIPYASGGGSFFRRASFVSLGGFDRDFAPYYWEDTDLGLRARRTGQRIRYEPRHRLAHDHQGTIGRAARGRVRRVFRRNRSLFVLRHQVAVPLPRLLWRVALAPAARGLLRRRPQRACEVLSLVRAWRGVVRTRRAARADTRGAGGR